MQSSMILHDITHHPYYVEKRDLDIDGNHCSYSLYLRSSNCNDDNKELIGRCDINIHYHRDRYKNYVYVSHLHIDVKFRGRGYGTAILNYVLQECHEKGLNYVKLVDGSDRCQERDNIYRKLGLNYEENNLDYANMKGNIRHILYGINRTPCSFCDVPHH